MVEPESRPALWTLISIYRGILKDHRAQPGQRFLAGGRLTEMEKLEALLQAAKMRCGKMARPAASRRRDPNRGGNHSTGNHPRRRPGRPGRRRCLAEARFEVEVIEKRPVLGGRASSFFPPGETERIDNCQHVLLGCCTNLLDFFRRTGMLDQFRFYNSFLFLGPKGAST